MESNDDDDVGDLNNNSEEIFTWTWYKHLQLWRDISRWRSRNVIVRLVEFGRVCEENIKTLGKNLQNFSSLGRRLSLIRSMMELTVNSTLFSHWLCTRCTRVFPGNPLIAQISLNFFSSHLDSSRDTFHCLFFFLILDSFLLINKAIFDTCQALYSHESIRCRFFDRH